MKLKDMKRIKAHKAYQCKGCGGTINVGEYYAKGINKLGRYDLDRPRFAWAAYKVHHSQDCFDRYWEIVKSLAYGNCAAREATRYHENTQTLRRF